MCYDHTPRGVSTTTHPRFRTPKTPRIRRTGADTILSGPALAVHPRPCRRPSRGLDPSRPLIGPFPRRGTPCPWPISLSAAGLIRRSHANDFPSRHRRIRPESRPRIPAVAPRRGSTRPGSTPPERPPRRRPRAERDCAGTDALRLQDRGLTPIARPRTRPGRSPLWEIGKGLRLRLGCVRIGRGSGHARSSMRSYRKFPIH